MGTQLLENVRYVKMNKNYYFNISLHSQFPDSVTILENTVCKKNIMISWFIKTFVMNIMK